MPIYSSIQIQHNLDVWTFDSRLKDRRTDEPGNQQECNERELTLFQGGTLFESSCFPYIASKRTRLAQTF